MSETANSRNPTKITIGIGLVVLILAYLFFFSGDKAEEITAKEDNVAGNTPPESSKKPTDQLDMPALERLKRTIKNSSVFVSIDKEGKQTLLGNDLEPAERCTPNGDIKHYKADEKMKRCAAFNQDVELLSIKNSSLLISKGSYIFTYFVNGSPHQICYNNNWARMACP